MLARSARHVSASNARLPPVASPSPTPRLTAGGRLLVPAPHRRLVGSSLASFVDAPPPPTRTTLSPPSAALPGPMTASRAAASFSSSPGAGLPGCAGRRWFSSSSSASSENGTGGGGGGEEHAFQAETRQLLDIVTNSLYTDKEVFLRELISNASDSLEKLRHLQATGMEATDPDEELEIILSVDPVAKTLTVTDTGVGLSKAEMQSLLGTIARSGSKAFVQEAKASQDSSSSSGSDIIGQFGVGFYSAFMVGERVEVASKPADKKEGAHVWSSEGSGSYSIRPYEEAAAPVAAEAEGEAEGEGEGLKRGCRLTIHLKGAEVNEWTKPERLKEVVAKYSNFVNFPIKLQGEVVNTVQAIWTQNPSEVDDEAYSAFYKFVSGQYDEPTYRIHFRADAPLDLKVLLFVPSYHGEQWGGGRMEPGVSLYSRKVLIEKDSAGLLPDYLRFVKGVVDSEDLPLSISREKPQDSRLLAKIQNTLVKKVLRFLNDKARKEPEAYRAWFKDFGFFIKEGVCHDFANQAECAKLLLFESSHLPSGELTSLDEYISRCTPEQDQLYFLNAPSRAMAEASPYYEAFKGRKDKREVLFVYNPIDEFVMTNLGTFNKRRIVSAESKDVELGEDKGEDDEETEKEEEDEGEGEGKKKKKNVTTKALTEEEVKALGSWMVSRLPKKLSAVRQSSRLAASPCLVVEHESGSLRRMMRAVEQQASGGDGDGDMFGRDALPPQVLEVNPKHPLIIGLDALRARSPASSPSNDEGDDEDDAQMVLEQLVDNALVGAGLVDDPRAMVGRVNALMLRLLETTAAAAAGTTTETTTNGEAEGAPAAEDGEAGAKAEAR